MKVFMQTIAKVACFEGVFGEEIAASTAEVGSDEDFRLFLRTPLGPVKLAHLQYGAANLGDPPRPEHPKPGQMWGGGFNPELIIEEELSESEEIELGGTLCLGEYEDEDGKIRPLNRTLDLTVPSRIVTQHDGASGFLCKYKAKGKAAQ